MRHVEPSIFQAVVNGSADDAVMSELFGLEHSHSPASERLRQEMAELEDRVLEGRATEAELQRYAELKRLLPGGIGEAANRSLRALLATWAP